jgi:hypothetical protein
VFDGHRQACGSDHGGDGFGDAIGIEHQTGSEVAALDAVAGAADVEVDAVVAPGFGKAGAVGEADRVIAADLEDEGFFVRGEAKEPIEVAMDDRLGGDHFGVEHHPPTDLPREKSEMPIGALHHGRNAEGIMPGLHSEKIKPPAIRIPAIKSPVIKPPEINPPGINRRAELFNRRAELFNRRAELFNRRAELFDRRAELFDRRAELFDRRAGLFAGLFGL